MSKICRNIVENLGTFQQSKSINNILKMSRICRKVRESVKILKDEIIFVILEEFNEQQMLKIFLKC